MLIPVSDSAVTLEQRGRIVLDESIVDALVRPVAEPLTPTEQARGAEVLAVCIAEARRAQAALGPIGLIH